MTALPKCAKCGKRLSKGAGTGRPAKYCSEACRRAAEFELRRIQRHLERLEREAETWKAGRRFYPWGSDQATESKRVAKEVERLENRLRELLEDAGDEVSTGKRRA